MRCLFVAWIFCAAFMLHGNAQPYLDVATLRFQHSPDAGIVRQGFRPNQFNFFQAQVQVPLIVKKDSSILLLNPLVEQWSISSPVLAQVPDNLRGITLVGGYIKPWSKKLTTTTLLVARWNGAGNFSFENRFQLGTVMLATLTRSSFLKYKFGLYYNREFFGNFFIPLVGVEWKLNNRLQLFGTLPGSLVLERKVTSRFYFGASFRAITNSFRFASANATNNFLRIDDNQLQAFADLYLTRQLVFTGELGHSIFRRFRTGYTGGTPKYLVTDKFNDGLLFRATMAYRLRFD